MQTGIIMSGVYRDRHRRLVAETQRRRQADVLRHVASPGRLRQAVGRLIIKMGRRVAGLPTRAGSPTVEVKA